MTEKTAEEKLRQALEDSTTSGSEKDSSREKTKPRPSRTRKRTSSGRTEKPESVGSRVDSFIDDFERKIEQSLSAVKSPSEPQVKSRVPQKSPSRRHELEIPKPEIPHEVHRKVKASPVIPEPAPEPVIAPEPSHEPVTVPEITPEPVQETITFPEQADTKPDIPEIITEPEPLEEPELPEVETVTPEPDTAEVLPEILPEVLPVEDLPVIEEVPEVVAEPEHEPEHEPEPEALQPETVLDIMPEAELEPEPVQDIPEIIPEVEPVEDFDDIPELPDIPVIEAEEADEVHDNSQDYNDEDGLLPDIPIIEPEEQEEDDMPDFIDEQEFQPEFDEQDKDIQDEDDVPVIDDEPEDEPPELQEAELVEAPETEDEFADGIDSIDIQEDTSAIDNEDEAFNDEPLDEEPALPDLEDEDAPPYDTEEDTAGIFADDDDVSDDTANDFAPSADVVVNVDDELPQISAPEYSEPDPEAESVPVTVTMPETTKTAEDKLMADIAEAMTGNPLSLEAQGTPGLYNLPEGFIAEEAGSGTSQSAEDKLKANIAQALSESPISTAQSQARQDLEQDLNPFDELSIPDTLFQRQEAQAHEQEEPDTLEQSLPEEQEDEFLPEFDAVPENVQEPEEIIPDDMPEVSEIQEVQEVQEQEQEQEPEFEPEPEPQPEPETETQEDDEELSDPFAIPDEIMAMSHPDDEPENEPEPEPDTQEELADLEDIPFTVDEQKQEQPPLHQPEPMTEQESLAQEVAAMSQEFGIDEQENTAEPEAMITDIEPDFGTDNIHEEGEPESNMPEQSLLNDGTDDVTQDMGDDWDISSLGELGAVATFHDDEQEQETYSPPEPKTVPEEIAQPAGIIHSAEDAHKEKTMSIREKLATRKNSNPDAPSGKKKSGGGGILLPSLLVILTIIGALILWQLMQVSDKITSLAMNSSGFESVSGVEAANPSYDYAIDFILDPNLTDRMSQRGREGWQVVGSRRTQDSTTGQYGYEFIFMRRTPAR